MVSKLPIVQAGGSPAATAACHERHQGASGESAPGAASEGGGEWFPFTALTRADNDDCGGPTAATLLQLHQCQVGMMVRVAADVSVLQRAITEHRIEGERAFL